MATTATATRKHSACTTISMPRDVLTMLRRAAAKRAAAGARPSVSALLTELARANASALEQEVTR